VKASRGCNELQGAVAIRLIPALRAGGGPPLHGITGRTRLRRKSVVEINSLIQEERAPAVGVALGRYCGNRGGGGGNGVCGLGVVDDRFNETSGVHLNH